MSTISKKHNYDRVFIRKINYQHLQSGASSTYIILESKIPYYEAVTLNLTCCNSHMKKTRTKFLWKSKIMLKITCQKNNFMNASWTKEYNCMHDMMMSYIGRYMMPYIGQGELHIIGIFRSRIGDRVSQDFILDSRISS